jgi:hypothetical protein
MAKASEMFLAAKQWMRAHPDDSDEEVRIACGIHLFDAAVVAEARKDLAADRMESGR